MADPRPQRLGLEQRRLARRYAKAQVPDPAILGALRAQVRQTWDDAEMDDDSLQLALMALQVMHDADTEDLDDHRDLGKATVQLIIYASATGQRLNAQQEPWDGADIDEDDAEEARKKGYREVSAKACSMAQFFGRIWCVVDPTGLGDDAAKAAKDFAAMSAKQQREEVMKVAREVGLRLAVVEEVA